MNVPGPELIYVYLDEDGRPSSMTTKREYVPGVRYIRADLAQPASVPEDVRQTLDNGLSILAFYVKDDVIQRARAWLDSQRTADEDKA